MKTGPCCFDTMAPSKRGTASGSRASTTRSPSPSVSESTKTHVLIEVEPFQVCSITQTHCHQTDRLHWCGCYCIILGPPEYLHKPIGVFEEDLPAFCEETGSCQIEVFRIIIPPVFELLWLSYVFLQTLPHG